ncbi:flagellar hook-basal body complex protein FliE [Virgibacillus subterraneus]|uniref:Flagellar hook-basal body complex protein FliE n=2 Tax=Virgibacillus TaxID=84406 RepID=A0A1H1C9M4_9BACI|nr:MULTISPECIES: flagellar hook-basal body complex protein FliE [Virgibacillus]SDQ60789.1 flagellar hook-basal body complex protein FliE [Virgibacillus salinus]SEQ58428.1 flagellar hook-basal body complex protein FliE [Virgibacillus subterraneus]
MNPLVNGVTQPAITNPGAGKPSISPGEAQSNFANSLKAAIEQVNDTQVASNSKTEAMANGEIDDLHNVMITAQKASITLETSVQVQRKVIDAYKEIMRMQI